MNISVSRVPSDHADFLALVRLLDDAYFETYGDVYLNYQPLNALCHIRFAVVAYACGIPAACGGLAQIDADTAELKRIFVKPAYRRQGLARRVIAELEAAARESGCARIALETGADMAAAIALYQKLGYALSRNYGPYAGDDACVCMTKQLGAVAGTHPTASS